MKSILVTGGAGFIGSNFIRYLVNLRDSPERIIILDALTYAGHLENLRGIIEPERVYVPTEGTALKDVEFEISGNSLQFKSFSAPLSAWKKLEAFGFRTVSSQEELVSLLKNEGVHFVFGDINDRKLVKCLIPLVNYVVHMAAETHVDRSILDPGAFLRTDVNGTYVLLEAAKDCWENYENKKFLHVSTDEIYGEIEEGFATEDYPLRPRNPYASAKAAADMLARAFCTTYGLPVVVARPSNNYGPYQHPEKLIPLMITNALEDKPLPIYGDGRQRRDWLFVEDTAKALYLLLEKGRIGSAYNISGRNERENLSVVKEILRLLGKPESLIRFVKDRPAHDRRYAMDSSKIEKELGFVPSWSFEEGLKRTVEFYRERRDWWKKIKEEDEETKEFLRKWYSLLEL